MEPVAPGSLRLETKSPKVKVEEAVPTVPVLADSTTDGESQNLTTEPGPNDLLLGRGGGMCNVKCLCIAFSCFVF
jgi:hypothetical protein